jgi:DNA-binding transcriptional LysR family regulator
VTVHEALADSLIRMTLAGDVDFVIMTMRQHEIDPALTQDFLQKRELPVVVMGSNHPLSTREEFDLDELNGLKWILPPAPDGMRLDFERLFESARLPSPQPTIESNSVLFIRAVLREGDFATYLPARLVQQDMEQNALRCADIKADRRASNVGFIYRRQCVLTPTARMLMDRITIASHVVKGTETIVVEG